MDLEIAAVFTTGRDRCPSDIARQDVSEKNARRSFVCNLALVDAVNVSSAAQAPPLGFKPPH